MSIVLLLLLLQTMSVEFPRGITSGGNYALFADLQEVGDDLDRRLPLSQEMISGGISSESSQDINTYYGTSSDPLQVLNIHYAHVRAILHGVGITRNSLLYCYTED